MVCAAAAARLRRLSAAAVKELHTVVQSVKSGNGRREVTRHCVEVQSLAKRFMPYCLNSLQPNGSGYNANLLSFVTNSFKKTPETWPLNHLFLAGQVALVLARAIPCPLLGHDSTRFQPRVYSEYYFKEAVSPWYEKHKAFLNKEGFYIERINHGVFLSDRPCGCLQDGELCGDPADYGFGAVLVKDTHSLMIGLVNKVFCTERSRNVDEWDEEETVSHDDLVSCTTFVPTTKATMATGSYVSYPFEFSSQIFGVDGHELCCSQCFYFENNVTPEDVIALGKHFHGCYEAMFKIGFYIALDVIHQKDWSDESLADLWFAAAGANIDTFNTWIEKSLAICVRVQDERRDRIVERVRDLAL